MSHLAVHRGARAETSSPSRARPTPSAAPRAISERRGLSSEGWVQLVLYSVVALLLLFAARPSSGSGAAAAGTARTTVESRVASIRAAVARWREREGRWPPSLVVALTSEPSPWRVQSAAWTDAQPSSEVEAPEDQLLNPVNGLSTVWILAEDASFPVLADGSTGWIYSQTTGEVRVNSPGTDEVDGKPWYGL